MECASAITESINNRISIRNIPSHSMQPYFSMRPASTKYTLLPIVEPRIKSKVKLETFPYFNTSNTFNPGDRVAPWSGFVHNIQTESELRNQVYALQHCSKSVYVPSSTSDLYSYKSQNTEKINQPHPLLFQTDFFPQCTKQINSGDKLFFNNTREM